MENSLKRFRIELLTTKATKLHFVEADNYEERNGRIWFFNYSQKDTYPRENEVVTSFPAHCTIVYNTNYK